MADKRKRRFGRVRKLPSGRYQARYRGPDGIDHPGPNTFPTKRDAEQWLNLVEVEVLRGTWLNPDLGKVPLGEYLTTWIAHRPGLRPRTVDLYTWLNTKYIEPTLSGASARRHHPRHGPGLASPPAFPRRLRDHGCQGVPPAARRPEHRRG